MRQVKAVELRAFLLDRLGLLGPLWTADMATAGARELAMLQMDSIRVCGLRNHELAWVARTEAGVPALYDALYAQGHFRETHYPVFATRRDWLPHLLTAFADLPERAKEGRRRLAPVMRQVMKHIREHGPSGPADFTSERIVGGFNTVKATTQALEYLWTDRKLQIAGRTDNFHRLFDLTERAAPELVGWKKPARADYEAFLFDSALAVLKAATSRQLAERVRIHYGHWRGPAMKPSQELVERHLKRERARSVEVADLPDRPVYWYLPADEPGWERAARALEGGAAAADGTTVRIVPPLDNLLYSRRRLEALFGLDYKFEAYTPIDARRFYFAMPIVHQERIVGLIDAKLDRSARHPAWNIVGLELRESVPAEPLRAGIHRLARIAGAEKVAVTTRAPRDLKRALAGKVT
jgi:uncharacterized protein YcaQ